METFLRKQEKTVRVGVIGAGAWAIASHLPNLARRGSEVALVGIASRDANLEELREQWGFEMASPDFRDVLAGEVDACVVASPAGLHYEHAMAALEAGAHVLIEKPMVISSEHAASLVACARAHDRELIVAFGWNYKPMVLAAKRKLEQEGIGEVEHLSIQMASSMRELLSGGRADYGQAEAPASSTWTRTELAGGGYGQAQLSHALGLALWLTGLRVEGAFALAAAGTFEGVELHNAAVLRFDNGAIGTLSGASVHEDPRHDKHELEVRAIGTDGQFHLDLDRERFRLFRPPGPAFEAELRSGDGTYDCVGPVDALIDLALGRAATNNSPGDLGAAVVDALDLCYRSMASCAYASRHSCS